MGTVQVRTRIEWDTEKIRGRPLPKPGEVYEGVARFFVPGLVSDYWSIRLVFSDQSYAGGNSVASLSLTSGGAPCDVLLRSGNRYAVIERDEIGAGIIL
jgi:hypothetical protein